jgi:hypothetical protein
VVVAALAAAQTGQRPTVTARAVVQEAGVQVHVLWDSVSRAEMVEQLDAAKASGATVVRVDVGWSTLEKNRKGEFDRAYLAKIDTVIRTLERRRLKPLLVLVGTPCWASSAPPPLKRSCSGEWWKRGVDRFPPRAATDYANAMVRLARRYRERVAAWEIWNEPNTVDFWRPAPSARAYAALVRATYARVKAASPRSMVLAGSLAGADAAFTRALYAHGIRDHFDAYSIHPYAPSPDWRGDAKQSYTSGVPAIRAATLAWRDARPLWLTEVGWNTSAVRGAPFWRSGVSEATQATYLTRAFALLKRWPYVRVAVWYVERDRNADPFDYLGNFGLERYDGTRKPSFAAMQRAAAALGGSRTARGR